MQMSRSRKLAATIAVLALTAVAPAGAVAAQETPADGAVECAKDTVAAYWRALQGYPQMYTCDI
jgi:hypothetical protein